MRDGDRMTSWRGRARAHRGRLVVIAVFIVAIAAFFALGGARWLSIDTLRAERSTLIAFADRHFAAALALALLVYVGVISLTLPTFVLTLASGLVFGRWVGTAVAVAGLTSGATVVFVAARYLFADVARRRLGRRGRRIAAGFADHAWSYMLFVRVVPLFPFVLVNLASAVAPIPLSTYVIATAIGVVPATFVYANLGEALGRVDSIDAAMSPDVVFGLVLLGLLALTPVVVGRVRAWRAQP